MRISQHIPDFFTGFERKAAEVTDTTSLLNIDWVKRWSEMPGFYRYSQDDQYLMGEFHNGLEWWVIGRVEGDLMLPKWTPPARLESAFPHLEKEIK